MYVVALKFRGLCTHSSACGGRIYCTTALSAALTLSVSHVSLPVYTQRIQSLLETVEELKMVEKSGYRTPMSPRRRTTPCGAGTYTSITCTVF